MFNDIYDRELYKVGTNVYIIEREVPDLWISYIEHSHHEINAEDFSVGLKETIIEALKNDGSITIGYYTFSALETQKVDLTNYATKDEAGTKVLVAGEEVTEFNADTKLDIRTESATYNQVYAKLTNGTQAMLPVATAGTTAANAIPRYSATKQLATETPTASNHAANKQYVDALVGDIATALTDLHSYAMSLKGGEA